MPLDIDVPLLPKEVLGCKKGSFVNTPIPVERTKYQLQFFMLPSKDYRKASRVYMPELSIDTKVAPFAARAATQRKPRKHEQEDKEQEESSEKESREEKNNKETESGKEKQTNEKKRRDSKRW